MISVSALGIERIIRAVEAQGSELVSSKGALATCIEVCAHWYSEALIYSSRRSQKMQQSAARRLQAAANDLLAQLENDRMAFYRPFLANSDLLKKQLSEFSAGIKTVLGLQSDSVPRSGLESDFVDALAYQDHFKTKSPLEWLVRVYLIETYALNFEVKKGTAQKNYTAFVMAVLKELRIKNGNSNYSVESIRRATRGDRDRRKVKKIDDIQFMIERQTSLWAACGRRWRSEEISRTLQSLERLDALVRQYLLAYANRGRK